MLIDKMPKISCVTVTKGRSDLIIGALNCFVSQTYKNKELVVVSQGNESENVAIREMTEKIDNAFFVEAPANLSLGSMRNVSIELTTGEIICQWDDDDLYHSERLMSQYKLLRGTKSVACLYTQHLKYFKDENQMYLIDYKRGTNDYLNVVRNEPYKRFLTGSIMFRKDCFYRFKNNLYPDWRVEEDLDVLKKITTLGAIEEIDQGHHYVYVFHGGNTYERRHHEMGLHKKHIFTAEELLEKQCVLNEACKQMNFNQANFCTSPIVDFDQGDKLLNEVVFTSP